MAGSGKGRRGTRPGTDGWAPGKRRARIRGGDLPRGGSPAGTGHAGRRARLLVPLAAALLATLLAVLLPARGAQAETGSEYWDYNTMGTYVMYADFYTTTGNKGYCAEYEKHGPKGVTYRSWHYTGEASSSLARCDPHALAWLAMHLYPVDPSMGGRSPDNPQKASQLAVWMLQGDCSYGGTTALGVDAVGDGATRNDVNVAAALAKQALGHAGASGVWDRASKIWTAPDNEHQNMLEVIPLGKISLAKETSNPALTKGNDCYALKGASYGIYADKACSASVGTMTTDAQGKATSGELPPGTYWVRETTPSPGFALDPAAHEVKVPSGKTASVTVQEVPLRYRIPLLLRKLDADGVGRAQGAASLAGARLEVSLYQGHHTAASLPESPWRSWEVTTDEEGAVTLDADAIGGEALLVEDGAVSLPLGTLVVRELEAPEGYEPLDGALVAHIKAASGSATAVALAGWDAVGDVSERVVRGGLSVRKRDTETGELAQGDATLSGAAFSVVSLGPGPVSVGGQTYQPGEEVMRITTDDEGLASTGEAALPYGDYEVSEAAPPDGYLPNEAWSARVEVRGHETVMVEQDCADDVIRGAVQVGKVSRETGAHAPQGAATLAGTTLEVTLDSPLPVVVDGEGHDPGEVVCTIVTDRDGLAQTEARALPYGTYTVREAQAPEGYEPNESWSRTFQVREDGQVIDLTAEDVSLDDQVMRGGLRFNKVDADSMASVGRCPFLITSETTGEAHVVVTDENGEFDSERFDHAAATNANDAAVTLAQDGTPVADDSRLDAEAGVWFSGDAERTVAPWQDLALPYDTYVVQEVRCAANEGLALVSFEVFVTRDAHVVDRGTVGDQPVPMLETRLFHEGAREAPADRVTLTDVVTCQGLVLGREYTLEGTLHDSESGEQVGDASSMPFVPQLADETVEVPLEADLSRLEGRSVVAFEELWCDGELVARHADLTSENQTLPVTMRVVPRQDAPTPTAPGGTTPKTGDSTPGVAIPAAVALAGTSVVAASVGSRLRRRHRPRRRIY